MDRGYGDLESVIVVIIRDRASVSLCSWCGMVFLVYFFINLWMGQYNNGGFL